MSLIMINAMTKVEQRQWEDLGFNICAECGNLALVQSAENANVFASVAIENPAVDGLLCTCPS